MSDSKAKVYGKPDCYGCKATVRQLDKQGTPYEYVDITVNEVAHQEVKNLGFTSAPVVVPVSGSPWAGFSPDRIARLRDTHGQ